MHVWTLGWVLTKNRFWGCCRGIYILLPVEISWIVALIQPPVVIPGHVDLWLIDQSSVIDSIHQQSTAFSVSNIFFTQSCCIIPRLKISCKALQPWRHYTDCYVTWYWYNQCNSPSQHWKNSYIKCCCEYYCTTPSTFGQLEDCIEPFVPKPSSSYFH